MRRDRQVRVQVHQWLDGMVFALGLWLAHFIRFHWYAVPLGLRKVFILKNAAYFIRHGLLGIPATAPQYQPDSIGPFTEYAPLFLVAIPMGMFILETQGFYEQAIFAPRREKAWQLARSCFLSTIGLILTIYLIRGNQARGVIVLFGFCSFGLMTLKEELVRWGRQRQLGAAQYTKRVVLVGEQTETGALRADMRKAQPDLEVVGEIDLNTTSNGDLVSFLHEHSVNSVVLSARHTVFGRIEEAIQACELEGVEAWLMADFFQTRISQTTIDDFCGRPMLVFHSAPQMASWAGLAKQFIDAAGALLLLVLSSPVLLITPVIIKLTSSGPVFFRQKRAGLNGKPFTMYKFRTMVSNAEQLKQELASLNEMSGPVFKVANDPRVTKFGRLLRKFSVDELPQLINVLLGDMSLVGPRPLPVEEVARFDDLAHRRRLSVKPGLTCLWQVGGRNEVRDFEEWVRLDLEYIDHWSLWLDIKILWWTIPVVLLGKEPVEEQFMSKSARPTAKKTKSAQPVSVVTGGAGFLGSHLVDYLLRRGHKVVAVDNLVTGSVANIAHLAGNRNFRFIDQDVTEFLFLDMAVDYVWHFASPASPVDYLELPIQTLKVGSLGTHKALGLALHKSARFLLASTSETYGDPLVHPQTESYWGNVNAIGPRGCYDESKRFAEALTMAYHREHGVETRIVRIFNTYGPRMRLRDGRVVPAFISQALKNQPLTVFGRGEQTRSFCYCSDLIEGIYRLMQSRGSEPVNIGNPAELTVLQFAREIIAATGSRSKICYRPLPQDDPRQRRPDITRARTLLGWEPRVALKEGLVKTIDYFRGKLGL